MKARGQSHCREARETLLKSRMDSKPWPCGRRLMASSQGNREQGVLKTSQKSHLPLR